MTRVADASREFREADEEAEGILLPAELEGLSTAEMIGRLEEEMLRCAARLEFETAASLRDRIDELSMSAELDAAGGRRRGRSGDHPPGRATRPRHGHGKHRRS